MGLLPPALVAGLFVVAVVTALGFIAYLAWQGSKPSEFFQETISERYDGKLPHSAIDSYEKLKEKLQIQVEDKLESQGQLDASLLSNDANGEDEALWVRHLQREDKEALTEALFRRLIKTIEVLDRVQRDKPGNQKLWREKLVSERFYNSLCKLEFEIRDQIDDCLKEAKELAPGINEDWKNPDIVFQHAVVRWRNGQNEKAMKKDCKKADQNVKKEKEKEAKKVENEKRQEVERKLKEERDAKKAMEALLRDEDNSSKKNKGKAKEKAAAKPKGAKKK